jgi:hypothetical protein
MPTLDSLLEKTKKDYSLDDLAGEPVTNAYSGITDPNEAYKKAVEVQDLAVKYNLPFSVPERYLDMMTGNPVMTWKDLTPEVTGRAKTGIVSTKAKEESLPPAPRPKPQKEKALPKFGGAIGASFGISGMTLNPANLPSIIEENYDFTNQPSWNDFTIEEYYEQHPEKRPREYKNFIDELMRNFGGGSLRVFAGITGTLATGIEQAMGPSYDEILSTDSLHKYAQRMHEKSATSGLSPAAGGGWRGFVAASVGQAGPYMAAAVGATYLTGSPMGAFGVAFAVEGDDAARAVIENGGTQEQANMHRFVVGTINGVIEQIQVSQLYKFANVGRGSVKQIAKEAKKRALGKILAKGGQLTYEAASHATREAIEETLQEFTSIVAESRFNEQAWDNASYRLFSSGLGGGVVGLILGTGGRIGSNGIAILEKGQKGKLSKALQAKLGVSKTLADKASSMVAEGIPIPEVDQMLSQAKVLGEESVLAEVEPPSVEPIKAPTPAVQPPKPEITSKPPAAKGEVRDEMKTFFTDLYKNKYKITPPKITKGKDGIWIRSPDTPTKGGIFIEAEDWQNNKQFYETYLEDVDERVIKAQPAAKGEGKKGKVRRKISAKEEFKVGDVINTKGQSNMADPTTIREIKGNTLKFTDAKGVEYAGMARATVRRLIEGGSWERATKPPAVSPEMARHKGGVNIPPTPKPQKPALGLTPERLKQFVTQGLKEAKMTKAEMGQVELEPTELSKSEAVNKHIDYFEGITLPDASKIRPIQRNIRKVNGLRLAGKITAAEANKRIRLLKTELFSNALKEGVSVRTTKKGGKTTLALRQAGTYVPEEFSKYGKFKDIQPLFGGGQDITRAIQQMDGSLSIRGKKQVKGQAGPLERNVLWRTRDITKQKLEFIKEQSARLKSFLTVKPNSKNDTLVNNILREIKSGETLAQALKNKRVLALSKDKKLITQAVKLRSWYDDMISDQNALRQLRNQDEIPYRGKYSPEIIRDATIWERVMAKDKKPREIIQGVELPDYIKPNKPFNPRELARDAGIPYEERVKSATRLARNYLVTASKDIFNTSIIQNNKAFIQQLEAMGYEKSGGYLSDWTAEAYAGVKPKLNRAIKIPKKLWGIPIEGSMRRFNQARNIAVFPLNFAWNLTTQPSSLAFTVSKYGAKNTMMGLVDWMNPKVRARARKDYYSFIVKSHKAGRVTRQDVMNLIGENVNIKRTKGEAFYDVATLVTNEMEKILTGMSIQAAYRHGKAKGLTGKALQEYASDGGGKTQSMYNDEDRPAILRSLGAKTLTPYQTFNFEAMNNLREWMGRTGTPPENNRVRVAQLVRFLAAAAVFRMVAKKLANKDIYTWDRMPMPFSEYWFSPIVKGLTGKEYSLEYNLPSPVAVGVRVGKGLKDVYEVGDWKRLRRELITYGTGYLNIPGGVQINRTVDALIAYSKGGVYDRAGKKLFSVKKEDLKQAIFSGVYSTKEGREYLKKKEGKKKPDYPEGF